MKSYGQLSKVVPSLLVQRLSLSFVLSSNRKSKVRNRISKTESRGLLTGLRRSWTSNNRPYNNRLTVLLLESRRKLRRLERLPIGLQRRRLDRLVQSQQHHRPEQRALRRHHQHQKS